MPLDAIPAGWTMLDYAAWVDPILADAAVERTEWIYARTPQNLLINVTEWLATGATSSPLPVAWSMPEFTEWVTNLIAAADVAYNEDVLSKVPFYLRDFTLNYIAAGSPADQWTSAVISNGGTVSAARKSIIQSFIAAEIASGTWALTDDYWCFWAENPVQALTSIKQKRLAVAVNAPVFLPNRHYEFDGVANYINTGFVPSTHAVAMNGSNQRLGVYERTDVAINATSIGAYTIGPDNFYLRARASGVICYASLNVTSAAAFTLPSGDSRGWTAASRAGGGTTLRGFKNGVAMADATGLVLTSNTLQTHSLFIGGQNTNGALANPRPASIGFACVGAPLSTQQETDQFDNIQNWAIAVGAAVIGQDEVTLWANAVLANGGSISTTRRAQVTNLVAALKASSTWDLIDDLWLLVAENQPQALTSLKQRRLGVAVNAPVFTPDRGYAFNGTSNYIDTGFAPFTHAIAMTGTDLSLGVYERTNVAASRRSAGSYDSGNRSLFVIPRNATDNYDIGANGLLGAIGTVTDSRGLTFGYKNGPTVGVAKNGASVITATPAVGTLLPASNIYIGALSQSNVASTWRASTSGFVVAGKSSIALSVPFYNAVQSFMLGAGAAISEAELWAAQVVVNGGTVSAARLDIVNRFIIAEKAAGTWDLTDDYWGLWAENGPQARTSLKQRRLAMVAGLPTFTVDRGFLFNGTSDIYDTGFIPATHAVAMTNHNGRLALYERLDVSSNNAAIGCQNSTAITMLLSPRAAAALRFRILASDLPTPTLPVADARGFASASRAGTTVQKSYKNGVALADGVAITTGPSLPTVSLYIGGLNAGQFRNCAPGFACIGAPLSDTQEAAQYANVQTWAATIGANV